MAITPFRLAVMQNIAKALGEVTYENYDGKQVSLAGRVHVGVSSLSDSEYPAEVSLIEPPLADDAILSYESNTASKYTLNLLVQGFARENSASDSEMGTIPAYYLAAALKKRLVEGKAEQDRYNRRQPFGMRPENGNAIDEVHINTGVVRPADESSSRCFCWIPIVVEVVESLDNPFVTT